MISTARSTAWTGRSSARAISRYCLFWSCFRNSETIWRASAFSGAVHRLFGFDLLVYFLQRKHLFQLLEHGVGNHLLIDHLAQLELVEREHADHLDEPRRQDLLLRHPEVQPDSRLSSAAH